MAQLSYSGDLYYGDKNTPGTMTSVAYGKQNDVSTRYTPFFDKPVAFRDDLAVEASVRYAVQRLGYEKSNAASLHIKAVFSA
ncbi:MAG: hypothetical protein LBB48_04635 [Treponema sp.]|jgi:hypothetical protein|nr:hypothetical protein [Treponema sp.]